MRSLCSQREDLEGSALEHLPRGAGSPWIPVFLRAKGVGASLCRLFAPRLRWYSLRGRSPAYPFFRKEKIQLHRRRRDCDAETPERVLRRSYFLRKGNTVLRTPQSGLPPVGGIPAMPLTFLRNVWERGPPLLRRNGGGGRIPTGVQSTPTRTNQSEDPTQSAQKPLCGAGRTPACRKELFSLRKKRTA